MTASDAVGCRILVVEDEMLIALQIEDVLVKLGCDIVGPTGKLERALQLANEGKFDAAVLDVTIRDGKVYSVAEQLLAGGIPFVLASGYGNWALPEALKNCPRMMKPFTTTALEEQIKLLCHEVAGRKKVRT
jgi:two-component SAPR family response regulator